MQRQSFPVLSVCLFVLLFGLPALAQSIAAPIAPPIDITLGHSAVALDGPWRFHIGDNPQWSDPNFDDSSWETTNVGVPADSFDPNQGSSGFVPGWTAKGHRGYSGFAWYRTRVHLTGADGAMSLLAPNNVDDGYQVFVNGHLLGSFGNFSGPTPTFYITQPLMFRIPSSVIQNSPDGNLNIAFRFYMAPRELLQIDPGGMHNPPYLGFTDAIAPVYHVQWEEQFQRLSNAFGNFFIYLLFTLLILMLYAFDRTERILLLPLSACLTVGIYTLSIAVGGTSSLVSATVQTYLGAVLLSVFLALWAITWWAYFGLQQKTWLRDAIIVIAALGTINQLLFIALTTGGPKAPHFIFAANRMAAYIVDVAATAILILIAYFGVRKAHKVDWMLLLALVFYGLPNLTPVLGAMHIPTEWFPLGIILPLSSLTSLASLFCFSIVLMRRFRASQRRQQIVIEDVKQAQEVQQVLIPEELPHVSGLTIQSEYRPAREVGGDFFQIIPHLTDGSVLIVAGDVTGKGLQAGMLVALIVGTLRTAVETSFDPLDVIHTLNRRLCGRNNAHATCLALRIAADGGATLANAGHLPPYLNGKELPVEGAVPLGMAANAEFSVMRFQLQPGDTLVLISDGVVEAQNEAGRLFGFDRVRQILTGPVTASELASTAQQFGQQDDISVLTIAFSPALEETPA